MLELGIKELHEKLVNKEISDEELISKSLKRCHEVQEENNAFVTIMDEVKPIEITDDLLSGIPYGIKDLLSTKDILSTGSSNTLKDYVPFFDATCISNLKSHGCIGVAKTVLDEFGMGGTGTTGHTGIVTNPWDKTRMCAGSSAGSAASVAAGCYPFALGSDTGDSIRRPASFTGLVGYMPTYGMISRYGMFQFASSLDTIGVLSRSVTDAAIAVDGMKGIDENDMTSIDSSNIHLYESLNKSIKGKKLFYIKEICDIENYSNPSDELKENLKIFKERLELFKSLGVSIEGINFDKQLLDAVSSTYMVISCAESTSNLSNLTGISFGPRGNGDSPEEMIKDYRTRGFSPLIKRRLVIGSYVLQSENQDRYFLNAKRVRRLITNKMHELFKEYDAMIVPSSVGVASYLDDSKNNRDKETDALDAVLRVANFGGFPSITIPCGFINNLPIGINITGNNKDDELVLSLAYNLESKMDYKNQLAGGVK